jgi:hypothetical protein
MTQLDFWGYDADGRLASSGQRLVYFVECRNFVKIGFTTRDVRERMREFETGNPEKFKLIGTIAVAAGVDDRYLHQRFAMFRHRKEWFRKTPELMRAIERLIQSEASAAKVTGETVTIDVSSIPPGQDFIWHATCPACNEWAGVHGFLKRGGGGDTTTYTVLHTKCNSRFRLAFVAA